MVKNYISLLLVFSLILVCGCTNLTNNNDGTIILKSTPNGAEIYLNNTYNGTTPNTISSIPPGPYQLELRLKDFQTYSETINIQPNDVQNISVSLIPITATNSNSGNNIPLTIVYQGNGNYKQNDVIQFSGTGPKGQVITISLTESATGITSSAINSARIGDDGTWSYNYNLKKIPIALGQATARADIWGTNTRSPSIIINILPG